MRDDFNKWCDLWDKAQADGVFENAPKPPIPTPQTSDPESFFGLVNTHPTLDAKDCDVQYWNDVYQLSSGEHLIQEGKKEDVLKKSADSIQRSPNPIHPASMGKDQDLSPGSLGSTFSEKDIDELTKLKIKLHELTSEMAKFNGEGKGAKKLEGKITKLTQEIDKFSDQLCHSLGDKKAANGVEIGPI